MSATLPARPRPSSVLLAAAVMLLASAVRGAERAEPADVVLTGGKVLTVDAEDAVAEAVAVRDGVILAVGSEAEVARHVGDNTHVIHLGGRTVIPGIIETHCHAIGVARASVEGPYVELSSIAEVQDWIRRQAQRAAPGTWLRVPRADITRLAERRHPTPAELDAACTTHPVLFNAARKYVFNTRGFEALEITAETEAVPGGTILRDAEGRPRMLAGADGYVRKFVPRAQVSDEQTVAALQKVHRRYNEVGITSIFERATNADGYHMYEALRDAGKLSVRMTATFRSQFSSGEAVERYVEQLGIKPGDGDDWVRPGPLKITVDGGIHWGNTYLSEPYGRRRAAFYALWDPTFRGDLRFSVERMRDVFAAAHRLGWQMCCHVTGDAGVDRVLDALEAVDKTQPVRGRRFTLVHAYFPTPEAVERAARLGVCVDTQPYLYYKDADAIASVYGEDWAARLIAVGAWVHGGVRAAINSDHMIGLDPDHAMNSFNPFLLMGIAVERRDQQGHVYGGSAKLTRQQALRAVTADAAYLGFNEKRTGSLEAGKLADLAVLDRDLLTCPESEIRQIKVLLTVVGGKVVMRRGPFESSN